MSDVGGGRKLTKGLSRLSRMVLSSPGASGAARRREAFDDELRSGLETLGNRSIRSGTNRVARRLSATTGHRWSTSKAT
jgi:hypothetical protein